MNVKNRIEQLLKYADQAFENHDHYIAEDLRDAAHDLSALQAENEKLRGRRAEMTTAQKRQELLVIISRAGEQEISLLHFFASTLTKKTAASEQAPAAARPEKAEKG